MSAASIQQEPARELRQGGALLKGRAPPLSPAALETPAAQLASELRRVSNVMNPAALLEIAHSATDPRVRIGALRRLVEILGAKARKALLVVVNGSEEHPKVRKQAARLLGQTGPDSDVDLGRILASDLPAMIRAGAVLGLGDMGTVSSAEAVLSYAAGIQLALRAAGLEALAHISTSEGALILREAALDGKVKEDVRIAACRGLARVKEQASALALAEILEDDANAAAVRAAAADSLGRLGLPIAQPTVEEARSDPAPEVARQAHIAWTRLGHVR